MTVSLSARRRLAIHTILYRLLCNTLQLAPTHRTLLLLDYYLRPVECCRSAWSGAYFTVTPSTMLYGLYELLLSVELDGSFGY